MHYYGCKSSLEVARADSYEGMWRRDGGDREGRKTHNKLRNNDELSRYSNPLPMCLLQNYKTGMKKLIEVYALWLISIGRNNEANELLKKINS